MGHRHTVLVVDDEPDVVRSVHDLLRLEFRVLGATRASEGMKILRSEEVHVVMSDQRMPEMTGVEFLRQVRGEYPEAIRLLFTGYSDLRAVIDAINQGSVYRYISKPWDADELQTVIREAASRYDLIVERNRLLVELQQKNTALEAANRELELSNELKVGFIRVASHELRTPLQILQLASYLSLQAARQSTPIRNAWIKSIAGATERLQRLVDQIITMLQNGRFDQTLEVKPVELAGLVQKAVSDVQPFIEQRRQELVLDAADNLGSLQVDEEKIRDCLNHLLLNAIKFTPDAGRIELRARRLANDSVEVRVSDNGIGIEARSLPRIFEPFFTGYDSSHHSSGQFEFGSRGIGLGLSVVKAFVEMHRGTVEVASEQQRGTVLTITLPPT